MTNQDKISALAKAVSEIKTIALDSRAIATDNSSDGANTVAQDFAIVVRSLELPYLQMLESLEHAAPTSEKASEVSAPTSEKASEVSAPLDKKARPSPVHVLNDAGEWVLPLAKPPTEFHAAAVPTNELATSPTSIPETIQPAPHAPRRKMAGQF